MNVVQAKGGLLLPGLVEPHIHLEKAYLLDVMDRDADSLQDAIQITAKLKSSFTDEDMNERSLAVIRQAVRNGVTHMRCHAEVDPILGLKAMESALHLKQSLRDQLELQVVAFPQEGVFRSPGTEELMEEALRMGPTSSEESLIRMNAWKITWILHLVWQKNTENRWIFIRIFRTIPRTVPLWT